MKTFIFSTLILLASHLTQVFSTPTPALPGPPTRVRRAVGDTTTFPVSSNETWTLTVTLQVGSGADYDDDTLQSVDTNFNNNLGSAASNATKVTGTYTDGIGNKLEIDLDTGDDTTIGSKTNAYWGVASNTFSSWMLYQSYPTKFTARCNDDSNNGTELGFYEFTFTAK